MGSINEGEFRIGELSRRSGVKVTTIRFYESTGLLPEPPRTQTARRRYNEQYLRRLLFVRHARELGFETSDVRSLLNLVDHPDSSCLQAGKIARRHMDAIERKIATLVNLRGTLERMTDGCTNAQVATCRVIETLST